jgi:hypothetical protein
VNFSLGENLDHDFSGNNDGGQRTQCRLQRSQEAFVFGMRTEKETDNFVAATYSDSSIIVRNSDRPKSQCLVQQLEWKTGMARIYFESPICVSCPPLNVDRGFANALRKEG